MANHLIDSYTPGATPVQAKALRLFLTSAIFALAVLLCIVPQAAWANDISDNSSADTSTKQTAYDLKFNSNEPTDASTEMAGSTETMQGLVHGTSFTAPECGFSLPGYTFDSWNTKSDGTGARIEEGSTVNDLEESSEGIASLYAIWAPCEYQITFTSGEAVGSSYTQTMTFDTPAALTDSAFVVPTGKQFLGWKDNLPAGGMWQDGSPVVNLCTLGLDGEPIGATLTATWGGQGHVTVAVTRNGVPATGIGSLLTLAAYGGIYGYFDEDINAPGVYTLKNVTPGTYGIGLYGFKTTGKYMEVTADGTGGAWLAYCDVQIAGDDHCEAYLGEGVIQLKDAPLGSNTSISVTPEKGYHFVKYDATGCDPTWQGGDDTLASQSITINGQTSITAHSAANHYSVQFNANGGDGSMANQSFEYGVSQQLSANTFTRNHMKFKCWTLTSEGTGQEFTDKQEVSNLISEDGGVVTLYAQWEPASYWVAFDGNGGDAGTMGRQEMFFSSSAQLNKCSITKENHTFRGWNTEANGSGQAFADQAEVCDLASEADEVVTLYAQWERDYFTVNFDANGGSGDMRAQRIYTDVSEALDGSVFEREGYSFAGWNTETDGSGLGYEDGEAVSNLVEAYGEITLYAQWSENSPIESDDDASGKDAKTADSNEDEAVPATADTLPVVPAVLLVALAASCLAFCGFRKIRSERI